jgi:hypothetical protein
MYNIDLVLGACISQPANVLIVSQQWLTYSEHLLKNYFDFIPYKYYYLVY